MTNLLFLKKLKREYIFLMSKQKPRQRIEAFGLRWRNYRI